MAASASSHTFVIAVWSRVSSLLLVVSVLDWSKGVLWDLIQTGPVTVRALSSTKSSLNLPKEGGGYHIGTCIGLVRGSHFQDGTLKS